MNGGPLARAQYERRTEEMLERPMRDVRRAMPHLSETAAHEAIEAELRRPTEVYRNDLYQVALLRLPGHVVHLSVRRLDRKPIHDWRDLQDIKNALVGDECEAVELYPAESRRVDAANKFHLWAVDDPTFRFPLGFAERAADYTAERESGAQQRPLDGGRPPADTPNVQHGRWL